MKGKIFLWALLSFAVSVWSQEIIQYKQWAGAIDADGQLQFEDINPATAGEMVDPSMQGPEKSLWKNLIGSYSMARKTAAGTLETINAVIGIADAVQKQIKSVEKFFIKVENTAKQTDSLWKNMKDFDVNDAWSDPVKFVKNLEENVMQWGDSIVISVFSELPNQYRDITREATNVKRRTFNVGKVAKSNYDSVVTTAKGLSWYAWMFNEQRDSNFVKRQNTQDTLIHQLFNDVTPIGAAEVGKIQRRNELLMNYASHEMQGERITYLSQILMNKTEALSTTNNQRYDLYYSLD